MYSATVVEARFLVQDSARISSNLYPFWYPRRSQASPHSNLAIKGVIAAFCRREIVVVPGRDRVEAFRAIADQEFSPSRKGLTMACVVAANSCCEKQKERRRVDDEVE
jgi:hypothetical protein